jgi:hypothetical protein
MTAAQLLSRKVAGTVPDSSPMVFSILSSPAEKRFFLKPRAAWSPICMRVRSCVLLFACRKLDPDEINRSNEPSQNGKVEFSECFQALTDY